MDVSYPSVTDEKNKAHLIFNMMDVLMELWVCQHLQTLQISMHYEKLLTMKELKN